MWLPVVVTLLGGWQVEEIPLAPAGARLVEVEQIDSATLGTLAQGDAGLDFSFVTLDGGARVAERFGSSAHFGTGRGSGLTIVVGHDGGVELFRPLHAQALVTLGTFPSPPQVVTCDDAVTECVIVVPDAAPIAWTAGRRAPLFPGVAPERMLQAGLELRGAALHPRGRFVGLALGDNAAQLDRKTGKVTLFRGDFIYRAASVTALVEAALKPKLEEQLQREANSGCRTVPMGWFEGRLSLEQQSVEEIGVQEGCASPSFELNPDTMAKVIPPPYWWQLLDCPQGGWTSPAGTFVTECTDGDTRIRRMMRRRPRLEDGGLAPLPEDIDLPEAVALSQTQIFVMGAPRPTNWRWYRKAVVGKGLPFVLEGPSVVTFQSQGVTVEGVPWRWGSTFFDTPLDDDWHLVRAETGEQHLIRLSATP